MGLSKQALRQEMRKRIKETTAAQRDQWSASLCRRAVGLEQWKTARTVMLYAAMAGELNLDALIRAAWQAGKRVLLPVVVGEDMVVREVTPETPYALSAYGIREPHGEDFTRLDEIDLILVPGLAFDASGGRLGRGKGYYDRFLPLVPRAYRLGVCFPFQCVESVPVEPLDERMHQVLS